MTKVLVVHPGPHFSVADVHNGLLKGLRLCGVDAHEYNLHDRLNFYAEAHLPRGEEFVRAFSEEQSIRLAVKGLEATLYEWWPDVVVIVSGFFISPEIWAVLARRPHHVVLWCTESPYEDDRQSWPAPYADTVILNDPLNIGEFQKINRRTFYLPHSFDPDIHYPGDNSRDVDFGFVGTGFASRIEFFQEVDWSGINAQFGGNWAQLEDYSPLLPLLMHQDRTECVDNSDTAAFYRRCRASVNLYRRETSEGGSAEGHAMGPREVELAACGTFFLRNPRTEGDDLLPMLPTFTEPDEFGELLRWWLAHDDLRVEAAERARVAVQGRTFTATARQLLRLVDGIPKSAR
jgi:spore maturation protein CgeB